jgi:sugar lactone lactonase YvrE
MGGITVDGLGNIYVSDYNNSSIRKISPAAVVTTLAKNIGGTFLNPRGLAVDPPGNIYEADFGTCTIKKITPGGAVKTLAGLPFATGSADGTNDTARFNSPRDIAVDQITGAIYVTDNHNHTIRKLAADGTNWVVTTIAGQAGVPGSADGIGTNASFNQPSGIDIDKDGNLYVADYINGTVRELSPSGTDWAVTTIAGRAGFLSNLDGTGTNALFNFPSGIALDTTGNVYVGESPFSATGTVRKMTLVGTNWLVGTLSSYTGNPADLRVDTAGTLYIADRNSSTVRVGVPNYGQPIITLPPQNRLSFAGTNVIFSSSVIGTPPVTYQWQLNGTNLMDNGNIMGSQSNVLAIASVLGTNAGSYQLIISNAFGCVTSIVANETVVLPPIHPAFTPLNGAINLTWPAVPGLAYQLQYKTNLTQPDWLNLGGPVTTNGSAASLLDLPGAGLQRYYRVGLVQ